MTAHKALTIGLVLLALSSCQARAQETQATKEAYANFIARLETRLDAQNASARGFLWLDQDARRHDAVRRGTIQVERLETPQISGGTLEHWIGGEFLAGTTLQRVIQVDQDYAKYTTYYAPEIIQSRLLSHDGNHFTVFYRLRKHEIVTVVLDTIHQIDFISLSGSRYFVRSRSQKIREVQHFGERSEKILPEGQGEGFLWAMNSSWRMEQRDGGVYMECEVVTLGRSIPFGLKGLVSPILQSLASQSLSNTLVAKRRAVFGIH